MVKYIPFLVVLGCGGPIATVCQDTGFKSFKSVLPIDCEIVQKDIDLCSQLVLQDTAVTDWNAKMRHVNIRVKSVESWDETWTGESILGVTYFANIALDDLGYSLCHETLHAYDIVDMFENLGTILESPVLLDQESAHHDWTSKGFWKTDYASREEMCPLQMTTWYNPQIVVQDCYNAPQGPP